MASRRVRIKGIANIPLRRKTTKTSEQESENQEECNDDKSKEIEDNPIVNVTADAHDIVTNVTDQSNNDTLPIINSDDQHSQVSNKFTVEIEKDRSISAEINGSSAIEHVLPAKESKGVKEEIGECCKSISIKKEINAKEISEENKKQPEKASITRRKFLKPSICVNALNRNARVRTEEAKIDKENVQENGNVNLNEIEISTNNAHTGLIIQKNEPPSAGTSASDLGKVASKDSGKSGSDTEYHQPPASPTKILNRRIKAIPKLHQRRTSFSIGSASESEDDTRRSYNRIRNDSVCSANSGVNESHCTNEARSPIRKECTVVQRKCRRNEQTRKLAEARREFNMKFHNGKPDKQKLTMIDLIFYNPTTSPMSYSKRKRSSTCSSDISDPKPRTEEEEKADDPQPASDSDNELPAPQLKVGPNGEIVVDEKSLIIENAETKKGREALQQSQIVNGDDDTSYGIYKRIKRTKEWSKDETLRFYKALNTIGTDFTLMCELFPNRNRRELKMKFKKEERLNQALVNKAVMQPSEFDMTELRKDLEIETRRNEENKKRAEETKIVKDANGDANKKKLKKRMRVKGIDGYFIDSPPIAEPPKPAPVKKRKKSRLDVIKGGINSILSESDEGEDSHESNTTNKEEDNNEDEDEENVSNILKPTRYGRVPRARVPDSLDVHPTKQAVKKKKIEEEGSDKNQDLEPGSIVVVKTKTTTDDLVYKVYFVTDNQTKQQIDLEPNVLKNLTGLRGNKVESETCGIQTHNILTISTQKFSGDAQVNMNDLTESSNTNEGQLKENQSSNLGVRELPLPESALNSGNIEIIGDRIILPFDETLAQAVGNQNITVSHEDNKMTVVTEN